MSVVCIFHGNCADGFAAAWVVRKFFNRNSTVQVVFYPGVYQTDPPDVKDKDVILVDFSYKKPVLEKMLEECTSMFIMDHHKSALEDLENLKHPKLTTIFNMNKSGAGIAWDHFFGVYSRPHMINHIEDRDLWKFKLPYTREVQANIFSYPYDFEVWDTFMELKPEELFLFAKAGEAIERKHFKDINELLEVCTRKMIIGGITVPVANLPYTMVSDAGHILAEVNPKLFGACYYDGNLGRNFSLRSLDGGMDVSDIAKQYGGGGHKHAAGFRVSFEDAKQFEING